jgi:CheY-like chemotaxis protein/signal transduction histidine kinase/CHASE3 domain sensor protein
MPSLNNEKLFRKVIARNITLPIIAGLISSGIFVILINLLLGQAKRVEHADQIISLANVGMKIFIDGETGIRGYALTGKEDFLEPYVSAKARADSDLAALRGLVSDNKIQTERVDSLQGVYISWFEYAENIRKLKAEKKDVISVVSQGLGKSLMGQARDLFDKIIITEERLRKERSDSLYNTTQIVLISVVSRSLILSILIALYGRKQMHALSDSYEKILRASQERNMTLQHQQWLKTGQMELSQKMAAQRGMSHLGDIIIGSIASYLKAQVGAFYLLTEENLLVRSGTFAYSSDFSKGKKLQLGETLVGQAALEKRNIYLTELPQDYVKVSSGIGDTSPTELLLYPVIDDGEIFAVIELGFLGQADVRYDDFLKSVSESVIVAIKTAIFREHREKLLKEIQDQAEELQTQQEELRVMNEELEEQTRMLKGSQARLEAQQAEMEQTNAQLEEQAQTLENQKDLLDRKNESLVETKLRLEQKAHELQKASQYKSEFLANMSHELRTPLNSSLILAKLLSDNKEKTLSDKQVEFAQQILNSGNDLLNLINDILDLSKVESGKLDISADDVKIESLVSSLKKSFDPMAKEKKLELIFEVDTKTPAGMFTDRLRLEQILKNLLSNSLKFTPTGRVSVRIFPGPDSTISFEVKDTGIGIKEEQQEIIFEAFRQADGTTNRKYGGTGLGLSISRDLARLLGGHIRVESQINEGSAFTLTLPLIYRAEIQEVSHLPSNRTLSLSESKPLAQISRPLPVAEPENMTQSIYFKDDRHMIDAKTERAILVVEDDPKFAQIIFDLAHELKYKCLVTDSADEGIELAKKFHPAAVLLDMKLSDQSGLFVLDQLKNFSSTRHIPVHIISVDDFSRQAFHLGAIGYMLKPVKREQLIEAFEKIELKIKQNIRKVLIVEDNKVQQNAIQKLIEDKNLETVTADTGNEAFSLLSQGVYDCMIMDLNLPDMSGFELLEKINSSFNKDYPPIIVYTGRSLSREEEIQLNRYSRSVIIKGAKSPERLLDEVILFLHRVETDLDDKNQESFENLRNREKIFENRTILIVDDDMRNNFALTAALEQKGAKIIIAKNGQESLEKLESEKGIDIVLMDIMMPVMDGYEAIREIRKKPQFKKLPIIAQTAKAMKEDHQLCIQAGANDYLSKPIDLQKLLSLIRIWLTAGWR